MMNFEPAIWQEYDCPISQIDYDLDGQQVCIVGERFYCPLCGSYHTAGEDGPNETVLWLAEDGSMIFRELPKDAEEKAAWLAEVAHARLMIKDQPGLPPLRREPQHGVSGVGD